MPALILTATKAAAVTSCDGLVFVSTTLIAKDGADVFYIDHCESNAP